MPHGFWPLRTFIASIASGMGRPPRIKTPSMSKANANLSVTRVSGGVAGGDIRGASCPIPRLASSMAAAVSCASLVGCGGTTTVERDRCLSACSSTSCALRRFSLVSEPGGSMKVSADIVAGSSILL